MSWWHESRRDDPAAPWRQLRLYRTAFLASMFVNVILLAVVVFLILGR
jgi:hypothetical protein